ncbi:hypothetical protein ACHAWF_014848 [Thalassiosira exigua]
MAPPLPIILKPMTNDDGPGQKRKIARYYGRFRRKTTSMMHRRTNRKRHRSRRKDGPFVFLAIKVGCCILCICWVASQVALFLSEVHAPTSRWSGIMPSHYSPYILFGVRSAVKIPGMNVDHQYSKKFDAYGIRDTIQDLSNANASVSTTDLKEFYDESSRLKKQFTSLYGADYARYLLNSGITTYQPSGSDKYAGVPTGLKHTAYRIINARKHRRSFKISFGGYSVTVGRGNYFHQSYPFVLRDILAKPMELLGIELDVRNAAIGGVPSFPYGWCLESFLGDDVDVFSWDFSMNEAGGVADGLEAYLRQGLAMKRQPMLIVKDTGIDIAQERYQLLQSYVDMGVLKDPVVMSIETLIEPFLQIPDEKLPIGLRGLRGPERFGAPKGAPGQSTHHPGVKEHELYGWLLAMHFIAALELVAFFDSDGQLGNLLPSFVESELDWIKLPAPLYGGNVALSELSTLFYGYDTMSNTRKPLSWQMNQIHCRTSFDPILKNNLHDIIISGTTGEDVDLLFPKARLYTRGWVLDLGQSEKKAKKNLDLFDLGYIDSKKAYYGIKASGPLELFLPCEGWKNLSEHRLAAECFRNVVVCEVNEKHVGEECDLSTDLSFVVSGVQSQNVKYVNATGSFYWGRPICLRVGIPPNSVLTKKKNKAGGFDIGINLLISVAKSSVTLRTGPCSISHVVWEQTSPE